MSERYLIINADDFGICEETNAAIEHLFNEGRITSTTVMVPAKASKDACLRALRNSRIKMGVHLTLNSDFKDDKWQSAAQSASVPTLLDEEGCLHAEIENFYKSAAEQEVAIEIEAQYSYLKDQGLRPPHADSHCGTLYGLTGRPFLKEAFGLCAKYGLPFRFPRSKNFMRLRFGGSIPQWLNEAHSQAIILAERMGIALPDDILTNPYAMKDIGSYEALKHFYFQAVSNIGEGITELFLHPSGDNALFKQFTPDWGKRVWEYRLLLEDDFMKLIEREDIQLVGWENAPFGMSIT